MKKIAIISYTPLAANMHKQVLGEIFPGVSIRTLPLSVSVVQEPLQADVVVISALDLLPYAQKVLSPGADIVLTAYTMDRPIMEQVWAMERRGPLSVVHGNQRAAMSRRTLLHRLGVAAERMRVWYPGMPREALCDQVVTFTPAPIPDADRREVVEVETRLLSVTTVFDIALRLGMRDIASTAAFQAYYDRVCIHLTPSTDDLPLGEYHAAMGDVAEKSGLSAFTQSQILFYCDAYSAAVVGKRPSQLIGSPLLTAFPFLRACEIHRGNQTREQLVNYEGKTYVIRINIVQQDDQETGYFKISDYWEEEQRQGTLRRQVTGSKAMAKYTFEDIVGNSPKMAECKKIAQRMVNSASSILITGETGVGKELFAQSIHSASQRCKQPFIAVNCGAIVESLLESELFGYEKGAFTGANKNGKQGLFELAHKGTLFLDEIGEMPLHLQVRLLRVLQEKEVVRVGGDAVIPVDVRVIAATNKDIPQMIERREFRSDLFYRLNVLPLYIPPLSQRRADILALIGCFQRELKVSFRLSDGALARVMAYPFPGNVRELHNCVEYLSTLGLEEVGAEDLPTYFQPAPRHGQEEAHRPATGPKPQIGPEDHAKYLRILEAVALVNATGTGAGRRSIHAYLLHQNLFFSEAVIRKALIQMADQALVEIARGRGGVHLTPQGRKFLETGAPPPEVPHMD